MNTELEIIERFVRRVEEAADRIEERVNRLERDAAAQNERIVTLFSKIDGQAERMEEMSKAMSHWKSGAAILFGLGAIGMWVLDHLTTVKRFLFD